MNKPDIVRVSNKSELNDFIDQPWNIYRDYPHWTPPLKRMVKHLLDVDRHPFWKFSEQALFVARRGPTVVGRIAGVIDRNSNDYHKEKACAWGFFECEDNVETADALFAAVEEWGKAKGMDFLRGPLNPSTNYEVGMLIEGFERPASIMMPYNPPYYIKLAEACGFSKEKDLLSMRIERGLRASARLQRLSDRIKRKNNVYVRHARKKDFGSEVKLIREIYNSAWSNNWGFVPMTDGELGQMAKEMVPVVDEEGVFFIYYDDEPVGVCIILPDFNPLLKALNGKIGLTGLFKLLRYKSYLKSARCMALGVKKTHRNLGLPVVAFHEFVKIWENRPNYMEAEVGWNLEDNYDIIKFEEEMGFELCKRYRVFRKDINAIG
jgi:GNAT superfamily N-acetyltransferase